MKHLHGYIIIIWTLLLFPSAIRSQPSRDSADVIRINLLGYPPAGIKVAVLGTKAILKSSDFNIIKRSGQVIFTGKLSKDFGAYGPFSHSYRLNFSNFKKTGPYRLEVGNIISPEVNISDSVYQGTADFCLHYMREQRSGFNPILKDSCHTHDGYTIYGPMPDSTHIDVWGGWHDASDYLQYVTTSANATYHLLAAYRDFSSVFTDSCQANGLNGSNGIADILDEAKWGLDWLLKMHPRADWMFNQIADDRDHRGFRLPTEDTVSYGKGLERPVYFCSGRPQGLGKYKNQSTGTASTAGKFASAFALGYQLMQKHDPQYAILLKRKALSAYAFGKAKPGVCQTAPDLSPYYYAEDDWQDDMELAATAISKMLRENNENWQPYLREAYEYAEEEKIKPWLGADTARHYQWYPFINLGHYELAKLLQEKSVQQAQPSAIPHLKKVIAYYKTGIARVWQKAKENAFYRGVPFIWCSNNLTTSFAIECYWYNRLSGDNTYSELEQANIDWLLGCNPWGTSMIIGLPANTDNPADPHSALSHLYHYSIYGGLVDGPVYTSIYKGLIGVHLSKEDVYAPYQSSLAVYHDDWADYSTNEPTMDGTASLIYLMAAMEQQEMDSNKN